MDRKTARVKGRQGLGTSGRVRKNNKRLAARKVRNGKPGRLPVSGE